MSISSLTAADLKVAFLSAAYNISNKKEIINELNVFPVPDGDTGTNMTLTIMSAAEDVKRISEPDLSSLSKAISSGSLRGARGNSGVILSQLFRGFCKDIKSKDTLDTIDLSEAFQRAVDTAYKAVMKPKEGTILTVARGMSEKASEIAENVTDIIEFGEIIIEHGDKVLLDTPNLLPVLKEAGVVDSGGQGLMEVMRGALSAIKGERIALNDAPEAKISAPETDITKMRGSSREDISTADIKYTYCTEFIVNLSKPISEIAADRFKSFLLSIGDSLVFVYDDEIVKIHVHTNHPGQAFEKGLSYGSLTNMKIDNMKEEHSERVALERERLKDQYPEAMYSFSDEKPSDDKPSDDVPEEAKKFGFIAVSPGEGISRIFEGIGIDHIISGGQTMNPSTDDILSAAEKVNAETVFIFPNNSNIILAANQAESICKDKKLIVVPTTAVPQCVTAMLEFSDSLSGEENMRAMTDSLANVRCGEITYAVRDTQIGGTDIKEGDIMGLTGGSIASSGNDISDVAFNMIDSMADDESELISIYYGKDISEEQANALSERLSEKYPDCEVELNYGGQPIYYYIVSVE